MNLILVFLGILVFVAAIAMSSNRKFALPLIVCGIVIVFVGVLVPGEGVAAGGLVVAPKIAEWVTTKRATRAAWA